MSATKTRFRTSVTNNITGPDRVYVVGLKYLPVDNTDKDENSLFAYFGQLTINPYSKYLAFSCLNSSVQSLPYLESLQ